MLQHQALSKLDRPTIQSLAKKYHLKANGKTVDIIMALTSLFPQGIPEGDSPPQPSSTNLKRKRSVADEPDLPHESMAVTSKSGSTGGIVPTSKRQRLSPRQHRPGAVGPPPIHTSHDQVPTLKVVPKTTKTVGLIPNYEFFQAHACISNVPVHAVQSLNEFIRSELPKLEDTERNIDELRIITKASKKILKGLKKDFKDLKAVRMRLESYLASRSSHSMADGSSEV